MLGGVQVVAQVPRASARQSSAILSSIEFDRDATLFATAGVSKRISIFDFATVSWHWQTACVLLIALRVHARPSVWWVRIHARSAGMQLVLWSAGDAEPAGDAAPAARRDLDPLKAQLPVVE